MQRVWALISMGEDQQYAGNKGYDDDFRRAYAYDNTVPNSRQLSEGDIVLIRDGTRLLGVANVEVISEANGTKIRNRCPVCDSPDLKTRAKKLPKFRCDKGHEFDRPRERVISVTKYVAKYETSFREVHEVVPKDLLKDAAPRRNDQLAIEEVEPSALLRLLRSKHPATFSLVERELRKAPLDAMEGIDEEEEAALLNVGRSDQVDAYTPSASDTRRTIEKQIKVRRGQTKFRKALIKRYRGRCLISGCELLDVLEAAHIWPLRDDSDHHPENGLLLRSDLHTLFDLFLISIDPESLEVRLAPRVASAEPYRELEGQRIMVANSMRPAIEPLRRHWQSFKSLRFER